MKRLLPERAIDHAFITHMIGLFEKFNANIKQPDNLEHARAQFAVDFNHARATHREMMNHLGSLSDEVL